MIEFFFRILQILRVELLFLIYMGLYLEMNPRHGIWVS